MRHLPIALAITFAAVTGSLGAQAELWNVSINGGYYVPEAECFAHVFPLEQTPEGGTMPSASLDGKWRSWSLKTKIPVQPRPKQYGTMARVFLSFYLGVPAWDDEEQGRIDVVVRVGDYQVFECDVMEPGWHPYLVDLRPWAGQEVTLTFRSGVLECEPHEAIIALPRFVTCHGPRYSGQGGIGIMPTPRGHGMQPVCSQDLSRPGHTLKVDGTAMANGPLLVRRLDFLEPSTVVLKSDVQDYSVTLPKGVHWRATQLPAEKDPSTWIRVTEGCVEGGPYDIIPNFMAKDAEVLAGIRTKSLVPAAE